MSYDAWLEAPYVSAEREGQRWEAALDEAIKRGLTTDDAPEAAQEAAAEKVIAEWDDEIEAGMAGMAEDIEDWDPDAV